MATAQVLYCTRCKINKVNTPITPAIKFCPTCGLEQWTKPRPNAIPKLPLPLITPLANHPDPVPTATPDLPTPPTSDFVLDVPEGLAECWKDYPHQTLEQLAEEVERREANVSPQGGASPQKKRTPDEIEPPAKKTKISYTVRGFDYHSKQKAYVETDLELFLKDSFDGILMLVEQPQKRMHVWAWVAEKPRSSWVHLHFAHQDKVETTMERLLEMASEFCAKFPAGNGFLAAQKWVSRMEIRSQEHGTLNCALPMWAPPGEEIFVYLNNLLAAGQNETQLIWIRKAVSKRRMKGAMPASFLNDGAPNADSWETLNFWRDVEEQLPFLLSSTQVATLVD